MSQTENFFRKYSDLVLEAEGKLSEPIVLKPTQPDDKKPQDDKDQPTGPNAPTTDPEDKVQEADLNQPDRGPRASQPVSTALPRKQGRVATAGDQGPGAFRSDVAVRPGDPNRVQVAPNVQKSVLDYERQMQDAERVRNGIAQDQHPVWKKAGEFGGDVVGGAQARWNALKSAFGSAQDRQTGRDVMPDPAKPVDVIPNPPRGTSRPRESAGDLMREYANIIQEAEFKDITNKMESAKNAMKEYKPKK